MDIGVQCRQAGIACIIRLILLTIINLKSPYKIDKFLETYLS